MLHLLKKLIISLIAFFVIIITFSCSNNNTPSSKNYSINVQKNGIAISKIGDTVNFGKYYKYDKEILDPLEWIIIDKNDETQTALLITKEIIDFKRYYNDVFFIDYKEYMNWGKSDIRKWLNDDFYNTAFSENEKNAISKTETYYTYRDRTNANYVGGKVEDGSTNDNVFLLSLEELQFYFNSESIRNVASTDYAIDNLKEQTKSTKDMAGYYFDWMLRSCISSSGPDSAMYFASEITTFDEYGGIRPCINVYYYTDKDKLNEKQVGDLVLMGSFKPFTYPNKEKIRWKVLDKQDDKMLLLSLYGIDAMNYNNKDEDIDWEHSSIRKWLNNDFYQNCFNDKEKAKILDTYNLNTSNPFTNISAGNNTKDKIFFLSYDEVMKYKTQALDNMSRIPKLYLPFKNKPRRGYWYLRTPGDSESKVLLVAGSGGVNVEGSSVFDNKTYEETDIAIRPAMWISIDSIKSTTNEYEDGSLIDIPLIENKDNDYYIYNDDDTNNSLTENNTSTIKLGQYYINKADQLEPIEWIMLDKDEATGNQLLITKDVIEFKKFDDDDNTIWLNSYIRKWLNEDFYNITFNDNEKETIVPITKEVFTMSLYNSSYLAENGNSNEKVFLLSQDEATKYFTKDNERTAKPTQYVLDKGIETSKGNEYYGTCYWYLRSKGRNIDHNSASHYDNTFCINTRGFVETIGIYPQKESGIRPAIWYNPNGKLEAATSSTISNTDIALMDNSYYTDPQTIFFGTYFVNNTENYEPIEWYVIDEDKQNNTVTLCSKYALDLQIYGNNDISVWETSSLREWLNNTFYNNAFSQDEKNKIVDSSIKHENNIRTGIYDGNDTLDKVYILSERELNNYLNDNTKLCQVSKYSLEVYNEKRNKFDNYSMKIFDAGYNCPYWLRNPGPYDLGNNKYTTNSIFDPNGRQVCRDSNNYCFVRPVITIKK